MPDKKEAQNCWEFLKCPKSKKEKCLVYQNNMGRECWYVANAKIQQVGIEKYGSCFDCSWYKKMNQDD